MLKHVLAAITLAVSAPFAAAAYDQHERTDEFVAEVEKEYGIPAEEVRNWLKQAEKMDSVLEAIQRPAERTMNWARYQDIFLTKKRISAGKNFLESQADILAEA